MRRRADGNEGVVDAEGADADGNFHSTECGVEPLGGVPGGVATALIGT